MGKETEISWCHSTFNPWRGCTKVSAGCANCYAETLSGRNPKTLGVWGPNGTRVVASESMWREPVKWNKAAAKAGKRHRVFCASLADVFEGPATMPAAAWDAVTQARKRLSQLILDTPHLDWLLLTKRPENVTAIAADMWIRFAGPSLPLPPNVWVGTSVENQQAADERIPHLLKVPVAVRFLSCEPLLSAVDLRPWISKIGWVIVGGESGHGARPMHPLWAESLRDQCNAAGVAFHFKQWGNWKPHRHMPEVEWRDLYEAVEPTPQNPEPVAKCYVNTVSVPEYPLPKGGPCDLMYDVGKKMAGRLLDGRTWDELPKATA